MKMKKRNTLQTILIWSIFFISCIIYVLILVNKGDVLINMKYPMLRGIIAGMVLIIFARVLTTYVIMPLVKYYSTGIKIAKIYKTYGSFDMIISINNLNDIDVNIKAGNNKEGNIGCDNKDCDNKDCDNKGCDNKEGNIGDNKEGKEDNMGYNRCNEGDNKEGDDKSNIGCNKNNESDKYDFFKFRNMYYHPDILYH